MNIIELLFLLIPVILAQNNPQLPSIVPPSSPVIPVIVPPPNPPVVNPPPPNPPPVQPVEPSISTSTSTLTSTSTSTSTLTSISTPTSTLISIPNDNSNEGWKFPIVAASIIVGISILMLFTITIVLRCKNRKNNYYLDKIFWQRQQPGPYF